MHLIDGIVVILGVAVAVAQWTTDNPNDQRADFKAPSIIPHPIDNPPNVEKIALGRKLFFDTSLSKTSDISCATCHDPNFGFEDGKSRSIGVTGQDLGRHTPTLINLAWSESYFWDGRAADLEEQAIAPIMSKTEMGMTPQALIERLSKDEDYQSDFQQVFGEEGLSLKTLAMALAAFERTLVSKNAPFDAWVAGNEKAISASAKRGFELFTGKARCSLCHSGWNFTDDGFHDIGLKSLDEGRFEVLSFPTMHHAFKTPGLRNIRERAPYMHDGSLATLDAVIRHYDNGFQQRDSLSDLMQPLGLSANERADLIVFLNSLSSPVVIWPKDQKERIVAQGGE